MLWFIFLLMTCVAVLAALLPLARLPTQRVPSRTYMAVYQSMLADIDCDVSCGLIDSREVRIKKVEASRRLLSLEAEKNEKQNGSKRTRTIVATIVCLFVPVVSLSLYMRLGRHELPDQPLAARIAAIPRHQDTSKRIAELEAFIRAHPSDGRPYEMIAPFYQRERRFKEAVRALEMALRLSGMSSSRYASLGEAKVVAAQGEVLPDAIEDFQAALRFEPKEVLARYYLGVAAAQSGDNWKATAIWSALLANAPRGANWAKQVEDDLIEIRKSRPGRAAQRDR